MNGLVMTDNGLSVMDCWSCKGFCCEDISRETGPGSGVELYLSMGRCCTVSHVKGDHSTQIWVDLSFLISLAGEAFVMPINYCCVQ